jgi:uncharacterized protein with PIN domain
VTVERTPRRPARLGPRSDFDERDPLGRMALFSDVEPEAPATNRAVLECSACLKETPASLRTVAKAALPFSVHLPFARRYPSFMRCPACGRRTWMRLLVRR